MVVNEKIIPLAKLVSTHHLNLPFKTCVELQEFDNKLHGKPQLSSDLVIIFFSFISLHQFHMLHFILGTSLPINNIQ